MLAIQGVTVLKGALLLTATSWPPSIQAAVTPRLTAGRVDSISTHPARFVSVRGKKGRLAVLLSVKAHESSAKSSSSQSESSRRKLRTRRFHVFGFARWCLKSQDGVSSPRTLKKNSQAASPSLLRELCCVVGTNAVRLTALWRWVEETAPIWSSEWASE